VSMAGGMDAAVAGLKEGQCGVYTKGDAKLGLCVESVIVWGSDVVQVRGGRQ
jgi:hypothetical protein